MRGFSIQLNQEPRSTYEFGFTQGKLREASRYSFALFEPINTGILRPPRRTQNDRTWHFPLRMTNNTYETPIGDASPFHNELGILPNA